MEFFDKKRMFFEEQIDSCFGSKEELLKETMAYSLYAGGKRLRPVLFLGVAALYREDWQKLFPFALGIEMIHTYSLIHDDLPAMDNDDYRRGKPTNHKVYGEAMAILAGDGLLTEAFHQMTSIEGEDAEKIMEAVNIASDYAGTGGMVYGQSLDILGEGKPLTLEQLKKIHYHKTGALISMATACGALLGGAEKEEVGLWATYGRKLGLGFQIIDDILDEEGTFEELGKPLHSDESCHKTTYVTLIGINGAKKEAKSVICKANESIQGLSKDASIFQEYGEKLLARKA